VHFDIGRGLGVAADGTNDGSAEHAIFEGPGFDVSLMSDQPLDGANVTEVRARLNTFGLDVCKGLSVALLSAGLDWAMDPDQADSEDTMGKAVHTVIASTIGVVALTDALFRVGKMAYSRSPYAARNDLVPMTLSARISDICMNHYTRYVVSGAAGVVAMGTAIAGVPAVGTAAGAFGLYAALIKSSVSSAIDEAVSPHVTTFKVGPGLCAQTSSALMKLAPTLCDLQLGLTSSAIGPLMTGVKLFGRAAISAGLNAVVVGDSKSGAVVARRDRKPMKEFLQDATGKLGFAGAGGFVAGAAADRLGLAGADDADKAHAAQWGATTLKSVVKVVKPVVEKQIATNKKERSSNAALKKEALKQEKEALKQDAIRLETFTTKL
jgi:hypothetical protein